MTRPHVRELVRGEHKRFVLICFTRVGRALTQIKKPMRREETLLDTTGSAIPDSDWHAIGEAFAAEDDPLFGSKPREQFEKLRQRITNRLPRKMRVPASPR